MRSRFTVQLLYITQKENLPIDFRKLLDRLSLNQSPNFIAL